MTVLFAASGYTFDEDKWQLSVRYSKVVNPKNRNHFVKAQALWLDCTKDLVPEMREACRLITPQSVETSEYPLLWNLMFVPATRFVELTSDWQFEMAKRQAKFIEDKFTYTVTGWNPDVDLFMDAPTR